MRDSTRESGGDVGVELPEDRVRELEDRIEREASVAELGRRARTGTTADELRRLAAAEVVRMLGTARGAVLMTDSNALEFAVSVGWPADEARPVPLGEPSHVAHVCLAREVSVVEDIDTDTRFP